MHLAPLPPRITSARLTGRQLERSDLPYMLAADSDARIQMPIFGKVFTIEQTLERFERWLKLRDDTGLGFFIFSLDDGTPAGHAGIFPSRSNERDYELGYALWPQYWGMGYGTEMAQAVLEAAFDECKIERVVAITRADNTASRRVMEHCGMHFETALAAGGTDDAVRYAIDYAQWERMRRAAE